MCARGIWHTNYTMEKKNEKEKIYQKIIDNRYLFSIIMVLILTIIGFFKNQIPLKEWLINTEKTLSLWSNLKLFALILSSYELLYIITNKKQNMSVAGAIVLAFSGCIMWNLNKIDAIILGEIITILIYKLVTNQNGKMDLLIMPLTVFCSFIYMYTFRPFAISFGYLFFALIVWIISKNIKSLKEDKSKLISLILTIVSSICGAVLAEIFLENPYKEVLEKNVTAGISGLFTYLYTPLLPFNDVNNVGIWAGILSILPMPMLIALYYIYKHDDHSEFLLPVTIITVLETVYCISGFPEIIGKFTMLSGVSAIRVVPAVQLANLFIMFYFMGNIDKPLFKIAHAMRITIIVICMLALIQYPTQFASKKFLFLFVAELSLLLFMFLNYSDKKYQKVFLFFLVIISLIGGIPVLFL